MADAEVALITEEMSTVVASVRLAYVATVNADGTPNLSPKGSLKVVDGSHLAFANMASPGTARNVGEGGPIEINVVDVLRRRGFRFKGQATISYEPELLDFIAGGLGPEYPVDGIVHVEVSSATPVWSPVYDCTDQSEDSVIEHFRAHYRY